MEPLRNLLGNCSKDFRFAFRTLSKTPGFTAIAALSIALGIGANTAIFSLMDAVMWRILPVKDPAGLYVVGDGMTFQQYGLLRDGQLDAAGTNLTGSITASYSGFSADGTFALHKTA